MAYGYKDLIVWKKSMELVVAVYVLTKHFPSDEQFGLISQMRRCAVSIPSNIAEGSRRGGKKEFKNFLSIAFGSGAELETQIEISHNLGFGKSTDYLTARELLSECMRMMATMIRKTAANLRTKD